MQFARTQFEPAANVVIGGIQSTVTTDASPEPFLVGAGGIGVRDDFRARIGAAAVPEPTSLRLLAGGSSVGSPWPRPSRKNAVQKDQERSAGKTSGLSVRASALQSGCRPSR